MADGFPAPSAFASRLAALDPDFGAELQRVVSADPCQVVGENKTVLLLNRRQVGGASDSSGAIAKGDVRQATVVGTIRDVGKVQLSTDVLVGVDLIAVGIDPVIPESEFIDQIGLEEVNFA